MGQPKRLFHFLTLLLMHFNAENFEKIIAKIFGSFKYFSYLCSVFRKPMFNLIFIIMNEMILHFLSKAEKMLRVCSNFAGLAEVRKARKQVENGKIKQAVNTSLRIFNYITGSEYLRNVTFDKKDEYRNMINGIKFYLKETTSK